MTDKNHCPYPRKQSAPPLIPSDPDGNGKSIHPLPSDASLLINSCLDASDTTDPALVVKAINFLREYGLRVVVSRSGSHSDEPQHQQGPPRFRKLEAVSEQTGMGIAFKISKFEKTTWMRIRKKNLQHLDVFTMSSES